MSYQHDHRDLAGAMELFAFDEEIGVGLPLWLPHGVALREALENFIKRLEDEAGYQRVVGPHLGMRSLYERSGHLESFHKDMYPSMKDEGREFYLRPMNCPHHHKAFASLPRSYRQLPLRIAEYGQVYRYEPSGSLRGLSRVRGLCQNDAHIYIDPVDSLDMVKEVLELHEKAYRLLGLKGYSYRLSLGDASRPRDFQGPPELWAEAEKILRQALLDMKLPFFEAVGEGAFYGPKIDVQMRLGGSDESIASVQLDFLSGGRFGLKFDGKDGKEKIPWVIHRAPLGSHERFIAMLLEYFDGQLPGFLAPIQVMIFPVGPAQEKAARELMASLRRRGVRAQLDGKNGSLSRRIALSHPLRSYSKLILGPKELESGIYAWQIKDAVHKINHAELLEVMQQHLRIPEES